MTANLLSPERAKLAASAATTSDDRALENLIAAASRAAEKWCRRGFARAACDELADPTWDGRLLLSRFPVQSVEAARRGPADALSVVNAATSASQQDRAAATAAGLELSHVAPGTRSVSTLLFTDHLTLGGEDHARDRCVGQGR